MVERCAQAVASVGHLIDEARASGHLRPDFGVDELAPILNANAGVVLATRDTDPGAWRRLLVVVLDGLNSTSSRTSTTDR